MNKYVQKKERLITDINSTNKLEQVFTNINIIMCAQIGTSIHKY